MLYSDGIHLISDKSFDELEKFCYSIEIKPCWFHKGSRFEHYDIPKLKRANFFKDNPTVEKVTAREIINILKDRSENSTN